MFPPVCSLHLDEWNGDYDCEAVHEVECEDCLCNFPFTGGLWNPETGEKVSLRLAKKMFSGFDPLDNEVIEDKLSDDIFWVLKG